MGNPLPIALDACIHFCGGHTADCGAIFLGYFLDSLSTRYVSSHFCCNRPESDVLLLTNSSWTKDNESYALDVKQIFALERHLAGQEAPDFGHSFSPH